jgi:uncharacterized protein YbjT (DUF2867 family)
MTRVVTVFGGDGFVGRYVVQALLKSGARVRIASRHTKHGWFLKSQANLGQIAYVGADITRPETLGVALAGADAAINLVGILKGNFERVQRDGARNAAEAAQAAGVHTFIQMSAIGADPASASRYGRTKGEGEAAVFVAFPTATILRPSLIFGQEDGFTNRFAGLIRAFPVVPLIGGATRFQPVYVGDVAKAVAAIIANPAASAGQVLELGGPEIMSMEAINRWIAAHIGAHRRFIPVPAVAAAAMARLTGWAPGAPITWDQWLMLQSDNVVADRDGLAALGIAPTPLDAVADEWLIIYRKHGRFGVSNK